MGAQVHIKKTVENFFITRFTLPMDPILVAWIKLI